MSLAIVYSRASMGVQAPLVTIEVHLSNGKPGFTLVGLPEKTVKEAQDRVRSALLNAEFRYPAKRVTVNLAPADLPKEGGRFDFPLAVIPFSNNTRVSIKVSWLPSIALDAWL